MRAGDPPRRRVVLERSVRGVLLLRRRHLPAFHLSTDLFGNVAERLIRSIDIDPRRHFLRPIILRLHHRQAHQLRIPGSPPSDTAGSNLSKVGLWLDELWAEYLTVVATSRLIPFDLRAHDPHDRLEVSRNPGGDHSLSRQGAVAESRQRRGLAPPAEAISEPD